MKLDLLVFGAHPDDAEMSCSGIILNFTQRGKKVGIIDLSKGEMGTRGTPELRMQEAEEAARILGLSVRHNVGLRDVYFEDSDENIRKMVSYIRQYRADIIIGNAPEDRHPDHGKAAKMLEKAHFYAGLKNYRTEWDGKEQEAWRPNNIYHYIQDRELEPDIVVDITAYWEKRMASIRAYKSQFYDPNSEEPETYISSEKFWKFFEGRARSFGHRIGVEFGEGLIQNRNIGVSNLDDLI